MPSAIWPPSSRSGGRGAPTSTTSTLADCSNVLDVAAPARAPRMLYTSSFLALPPRGRRRAILRERLSAHESRWPSGTAARGRERGRADRAAVSRRDLRAGRRFRRQSHRPAGPRPPGRAACRARRRRSAVVVRLDRRCGRGARARRWSARRPARPTRSAARTLPQMRVFEIVRDRTGRSLPAPHSVCARLADRGRRGGAGAAVSGRRRCSRAAPWRSSGTTGRSTARPPSAILGCAFARSPKVWKDCSPAACRAKMTRGDRLLRDAPPDRARRDGGLRAAAALSHVAAGGGMALAALVFNALALARRGARHHSARPTRAASAPAYSSIRSRCCCSCSCFAIGSISSPRPGA